ILKICTLLGCIWVLSSTTPKEHIKYITEATEVLGTTAKSTKSTALGPSMTKLVVLCSFLFITKHFICFFCLFKFRFSIIFFIHIGMILSCQFTICFLYFIFCTFFVNSKYLIFISFTQHSLLSPLLTLYYP